MKAGGVLPGDIDLIIVATTTPDMIFPSTACILQHKLGVRDCPAFDMQAVCSGFIYALATADMYIRAGKCPYSPGCWHRNLFSHTRLDGPKHMRTVRRRSGSGCPDPKRRAGNHFEPLAC